MPNWNGLETKATDLQEEELLTFCEQRLDIGKKGKMYFWAMSPPLFCAKIIVHLHVIVTQ